MLKNKIIKYLVIVFMLITSLSTTLKAEDATITPASNTSIATLDGVDLSSDADSVTSNASDLAKTLTIKAVFSSDLSPGKMVSVTLDTGFEYTSIPGMKKDASGKWVFDSTLLPIQLQGLLVNAVYTQNPNQHNLASKAGKIDFYFQSGVTSSVLDILIKRDYNYSLGPQGLTDTFSNALNVSISDNGLELSHLTLESYLVKYDILRSGTFTWYPKTGQTVEIGQSYSETYNNITDLNNINNATVSVYGIKRIEMTIKVFKYLGVTELVMTGGFTEEAQTFDYSIDTTTDATFDIITITMTNVNPLAAVAFKGTIQDDAPIQESSFFASFVGTIYDYQDRVVYTGNLSGNRYSRAFNIAGPYNDVITLYQYGGRKEITVQDTNLANGGVQYLSSVQFMNEQSQVLSPKRIEVTFDDPHYQVTGVSVPYIGGPSKNIVIETNKGNTYTVAAATGIHDFGNVTLSQLGVTDQTEFMTKASFDIGGQIPVSYKTFDVNVAGLATQNDGVFGIFGKIVERPATNVLQFQAKQDQIGGDFSDPSIVPYNFSAKIVNSTTLWMNGRNPLSGQYTAGATVKAKYSVDSFTGIYTQAIIGQKGVNLYLREIKDQVEMIKDSIVVTVGTTVYSVADGSLVVIEGVDNTGAKFYKMSFPDTYIGMNNNTLVNGLPTNSVMYVDVEYKISNGARSSAYNSGDLFFFEMIDPAMKGILGTLAINGTYTTGVPDKFELTGDGSITDRVATTRPATINIVASKDFTVTTAANLNGGPWVKYDYATKKDIINLNPAGDAKYRLAIINNSGGVVDGYVGLIPVPKYGEKTPLTPATVAEFDKNAHLQQEAFGWTASIRNEIVLPSHYQVLYSTSYDIDKDSANFVAWDQIANKDDIRMVKIASTMAMPDGFNEEVVFDLSLSDTDADAHAGNTNIYSAYIYRSVEGTAAYKTSEPIAIRLKTGIVEGYVHNDSNGDQLVDASDTVAANISVIAYKTGTTEVMETTMTDATGKYSFLGLDKSQNVDIVVVNPNATMYRFTPVKTNGSNATPSTDQTKATISNVVPSNGTTQQVLIQKAVTITYTDATGVATRSTDYAFPGDTLTLPTGTANGYTFSGWYTAATGGELKASPYTVPSTNQTLYARYTINQYQLTYNNEGVLSQSNVNFNSLFTAPSLPTKTGYSFDGWYNGLVKWDFTTGRMPASDLTLTAKFTINSYTLVFNNDGVETSEVKEFNAAISEPTAPTKTGYTFDGWYNGTTKWNFASTMPASDLTLVAHYTVNQYVVTFNNEGTQTTNNVNFDAFVTAPTPVPSKTGFTFNGWYNGTTKWDFAVNKMPASNLTLDAHFTINQYTVTFNDEGTLSTSTVNYGAAIIAPPTPTKLGYTFDGWYNGVSKWVFRTDAMPASNLTLVAKYTINTYTLTLDDQGTTSAQSIVFDTVITEPTQPTKTGYTFDGWYNGTTKWNFTTGKMPASDLTLTAKFVINGYTLTWDNQGTTSTQLIEYNALITEPTPEPSKVGYTFEGWYNGTTKWDFTTDTMPNSALTLTAQFSINSYTLTFNDQGTTTLQTVVYNALATEPTPQPTKVGYKFDGWYNGTSKWDFTTSRMPSGNITLTAKFTINSYTLTLDNQGTLTTDVVEYDSVIVEPVMPTKLGYTFDGWYNGTTKWDFSIDKMPANDLTLTAKFVINTYTLTLDDQGTITTQSVEFDSVIVEPTIPTKPGYTFTGWYDGTTKWDFSVDKMPASDLTLTSKFVAALQTLTFNYKDVNQTKVTQEALTDSSFDLSTVTIPTKEGYTFVGWKLDNQYVNTVVVPAGGLEFNASWKQEIDEATPITIDIKDLEKADLVALTKAKAYETIDDQYVKDYTVQLLSNKPTKKGMFSIQFVSETGAIFETILTVTDSSEHYQLDINDVQLTLEEAKQMIASGTLETTVIQKANPKLWLISDFADPKLIDAKANADLSTIKAQLQAKTYSVELSVEYEVEVDNQVVAFASFDSFDATKPTEVMKQVFEVTIVEEAKKEEKKDLPGTGMVSEFTYIGLASSILGMIVLLNKKRFTKED